MEITLSANGKNKSLLESQVGNAGKKYVQDLTTHFNAQNMIIKKYAQSVQKEIDATRAIHRLIRSLLANNPSTEDANNYNQDLINKQDDLTGSRADFIDIQTQLAMAEKPQLHECHNNNCFSKYGKKCRFSRRVWIFCDVSDFNFFEIYNRCPALRT